MPTPPPRRKRQANRGSFKKGPDPRRHVFTQEERRRGGITTARKFTVYGRWHPDWWERCASGDNGALNRGTDAEEIPW